MTSDDLPLDGVRAVVTGSTRGFGEAVARELAAQGARLVVNGTDAERCAALADELGAVGVPGSVADEDVADALVSACVGAYDGIDLLVNNAGNSRDGMLRRASAEDFDAVIAVHLRGTWLTCRAAARAMHGHGGAIVNVVSGTAMFGNVGQSAYAAAKGGVLGLTRTLALELARSGVRVNAIAPVVKTDMVAPLLELDPALGTWFGAPEDVARVVTFLASPAAADLTGGVLGFDGTTLSVWSHPESVAQVAREDGWAPEDFAAALATAPDPRPNPDAFGRAVHEKLGVSVR